MDLNRVSLFHSELTKFEEILIDYMRYKELLFKLSPPEWQEAQRAKAIEGKVPSDRDAQDEHNREPEESASTNSKYFTLVQHELAENKDRVTLVNVLLFFDFFNLLTCT